MYDFKEIKEHIPTKYHYLLNNRLANTSDMKDEYRSYGLNGTSFNKCEKCGYDLLEPRSYRAYGKVTFRHPYKGWVKYYDHHKLILCDKCVDELNGQPWR